MSQQKGRIWSPLQCKQSICQRHMSGLTGEVYTELHTLVHQVLSTVWIISAHMEVYTSRIGDIVGMLKSPA